MTVPSDTLASDVLSPLAGSPLRLVQAGEDAVTGDFGAVVWVDRAGLVPDVDPQLFDALVTVRADAPAPWVAVAPSRLDAQLRTAAGIAAQSPIATGMFARLLRLGQGLSFDAALELESLAYSSLLTGAEFARWRATTVSQQAVPTEADPVRYDRDDDTVILALASPGNRNAMTAAMRDSLFEALANVLDDPTCPRLVLRGEGKCFSTGGHLPEFGTTTDPAQAHVIRIQRSAARLLDRLGTRAEARLHGACIGSGIEIPAAAARRIARADTFVQLPELRMGLIPGAGGTVTLARAIGRQRLFWLALGGFRLGAATARHWGLFHEIAR